MRDLTKSKVINVIPCPTANIVAEPRTKSLGVVDLNWKLAVILKNTDESTNDHGDNSNHCKSEQ